MNYMTAVYKDLNNRSLGGLYSHNNKRNSTPNPHKIYLIYSILLNMLSESNKTQSYFSTSWSTWPRTSYDFGSWKSIFFILKPYGSNDSNFFDKQNGVNTLKGRNFVRVQGYPALQTYLICPRVLQLQSLNRLQKLGPHVRLGFRKSLLQFVDYV